MSSVPKPALFLAPNVTKHVKIKTIIMKSIWNELFEFETRDLVERYISKRHGKTLNANRILQISSNFIQGKEYFKSAENASFTVRPLLQYYGVMALTKGLILCLDISKTEEHFKASHGLNVNNWKETLKSRKCENLIISVGEGTFSELVLATKNRNYLRANNSGINYSATLNMPRKGDSYTLKQIVQYFPDLKREYFSWIEEELYFGVLETLTFEKENPKIKIKLRGNYESNIIDMFFPKRYCPKRNVAIEEHYTIITYESHKWSPNISQKWEDAFDIGDVCIIPTLEDDKAINLLGGMYILSYVFGMMARYYPSFWMSLLRGFKGDKFYPFAHRILSFIHEKYPLQVLDFLNSPYKFEK